MTFWARARLAFAEALGLEIRHSQARYAELLAKSVREHDRWLDIGCGRQIVPDWALPHEEQRMLVARAGLLVGIDLDPAIFEHPLLTHKVIALASPMPFAAETFDLVTANMVMEHIEQPGEILAEIRRVLAPGGRFVFLTPNRRYYLVALARFVPQSLKVKLVELLEKRSAKDIFITHYRCNTVTSIHDLAAGAGFDVCDLVVRGSVGTFRELGPLAILEVLLMKLLTTSPFSNFNTTIMTVLVKRLNPGESAT